MSDYSTPQEEELRRLHWDLDKCRDAWYLAMGERDQAKTERDRLLLLINNPPIREERWLSGKQVAKELLEAYNSPRWPDRRGED